MVLDWFLEGSLMTADVMHSAVESRPIVVGVDGSDASLDALRWADQQARVTGNTLHVITTWEFPSSYGYAVVWSGEVSLEDDARRTLKESIEKVIDAGSRESVMITSVIEGHPGPVLCKASTTASLLVVGSRGHGEFAGMLLGSVSEFLTTHSECPVVIVRYGR